MQRRLEAIIAVIAFFVAILVAFGVYHLVYTSPLHESTVMAKCPPLPEMVEVMIASKIINTGEAISSSIVYEKWPKNTLREGAYIKDSVSAGLLDALIARRIISAGEPITKNSVVDRKGRGVLSALLGIGMRAISINLDTSAGMGGLLNPGDVVDVILTLNVNAKDGEETNNKTILCGAKVLAVDQHFSNVIDLVSKKSNELAPSPKTVTLEVTPKQALAVAAAVKVGTLSISLHSTQEGKSQCVEAGLKPMEQVRIVRGDGTQNSLQPGH